MSAVRTRSRRVDGGPSCGRHRAGGFGLVEVLVASVLVAVAMLGVARLQLGAFDAGRRSLEALAAQGHVLGIAERIRALHDAPPEARARLAGAGADRGCRGSRRCTPAEFAEYEAWWWYAGASELRGATGLPIDVRSERAPTRYELRLRRRDGGTYALEVTS